MFPGDFVYWMKCPKQKYFCMFVVVFLIWNLNNIFIQQANPDPNTCLGVFGLSLYTTERDLREVFSRYGPLSGVNVVYDQRTGRSRGFAFVYFERIDDSKEVIFCNYFCHFEKFLMCISIELLLKVD